MDADIRIFWPTMDLVIGLLVVSYIIWLESVLSVYLSMITFYDTILLQTH